MQQYGTSFASLPTATTVGRIPAPRVPRKTLFDLRDGPGAGYDEFVDDDGNATDLDQSSPTVAERVRGRLDRLLGGLIDHIGITYTAIDTDAPDRRP